MMDLLHTCLSLYSPLFPCNIFHSLPMGSIPKKSIHSMIFRNIMITLERKLEGVIYYCFQLYYCCIFLCGLYKIITSSIHFCNRTAFSSINEHVQQNQCNDHPLFSYRRKSTKAVQYRSVSSATAQITCKK